MILNRFQHFQIFQDASAVSFVAFATNTTAGSAAAAQRTGRQPDAVRMSRIGVHTSHARAAPADTAVVYLAAVAL